MTECCRRAKVINEMTVQHLHTGTEPRKSQQTGKLRNNRQRTLRPALLPSHPPKNVSKDIPHEISRTNTSHNQLKWIELVWLSKMPNILSKKIWALSLPLSAKHNWLAKLVCSAPILLHTITTYTWPPHTRTPTSLSICSLYGICSSLIYST